MKHRSALLTSLASLWIVGGAHAQAPVDEPGVEAPGGETRDWAIAVVHLDYADAEEVAAVLQQVLPPSVRVVPYYQTNSLIFSGDPALIGELTNEDGSTDSGSRAPEPADPARTSPASDEHVIARLNRDR